MTWTTLVGVSPLVVNDGRLLMIVQRRPYGVHWEARRATRTLLAASSIVASFLGARAIDLAGFSRPGVTGLFAFGSSRCATSSSCFRITTSHDR